MPDVGHFLRSQSANGRPHDVGEFSQLGRLTEYRRAQRLAVDAPVGCDDLATKDFRDACMGGRARFIDAMAQQIGIDHMGAKLTQMAGSSGFAGGQSSGKADDTAHGRSKSKVDPGSKLNRAQGCSGFKSDIHIGAAAQI